MNNISDSELLVLSLEENEDAKNTLFERYHYILDILLKKYQKMAYQLGIDKKDLYSEALYGFSDALVSYNENKDASIATFVTLCVSRRIQGVIVKAGRQKNKINFEAYSLDYVYDKFGMPLIDIISDNQRFDPLQAMTVEESYNELLESLHQEFSESEYTVFTLLANGFDYVRIAEMLNKSPKQIDNTIQRLKVKMKKILENRKSA